MKTSYAVFADHHQFYLRDAVEGPAAAFDFDRYDIVLWPAPAAAIAVLERHDAAGREAAGPSP